MSKRPRSDSDSEHSSSVPRVLAKKASISVAQVEKTPIKILEHLLDMTHVPPSTEASHFQTLATTLMYSFHLCVSNRSTPPVITSYELLEVEFYWYCEETGHTDPFVGTAGEKNVLGNWYFCTPQQAAQARRSNKSDLSPNTDRGQDWTREGLYLTFGIPSPSRSSRTGPPLSDYNKPVRATHGGILFRALRNIFTEKATVGPSILIENVLRASGSRNVSSLVNEMWGGDMYALGKGGAGRMFLRPISGSLLVENRTRDKPTIYSSPRVDLDLSDIPSPSHASSSDPRIQYLIRPYRFIQLPHLLGPPGAQTIYGLLTSGFSCTQIVALLNEKLSSVERMVGYLEEGRKKGWRGVKELFGEEGKSATRTMQGCMNMIGIVESLLREGDEREQEQKQEVSSGGRTVIKVVPSEMSVSEVFNCLLEHGCVDISSEMHPIDHSSMAITGGSFGDVWQGKLVSGEKIAIKCLRFTTIVEDQPKGLKRLMRETYMWSKVKHENVQQLIGITMLQGRLGMVSLWREHGNIQDYLRRNPGIDRHELCVQVASGVSYLHSISMVHGDIKALNILVSADGVAKLSDFDHSILSNCTLAFSATTNVGGGTLRWMAPELLLATDDSTNHGVLRTTQTDIYALGMTMLEIFTGKAPYTEYRQDVAIYGALVSKQPPARPKVLTGPTTHANEMWNLLIDCWNHDPGARPDAQLVLSLLRRLNVKPPSNI